MAKTHFIPPIEKRDTVELIGMAHCKSDFWQQEAKEQAIGELERRLVPMEDQLKLVAKWNKEILEYEKRREQELNANRQKRYSATQCFMMGLLAPMILLGKIDYDLSISELRNENYRYKVKQRQKALIVGVLFYSVVFFLLSNTKL